MAEKKAAEATADPIVDQGARAKELKLTAADCPYGAAGDNRDKWFEGFGEADPEAPAPAAE